MDVWLLVRIGASGRGVLGVVFKFSLPMAMVDLDGVLGGEHGADDINGALCTNL